MKKNLCAKILLKLKLCAGEYFDVIMNCIIFEYAKQI